MVASPLKSVPIPKTKTTATAPNRKNANIFVISQFRCSPVFSELKKIINNKIYGDLISFNLINHEAIQNWHPWENFRDSYSTQKSSGGG